MAFNYANAAQTALRLISNFGADVSIRRVEKTYDEPTGEAGELVKLSGTIKAVVLPFSSTAKSIFGEADNKLIEDLIAGKVRYILAAAKGAPFEPAGNDLFVLGSEQFTVKGCTPLAPAGIPLVYKIVAELTPAAPTNEETIEVEPFEAAVEGVTETTE